MEVTALDFSKWDALIDRIAKDLHEGKLKPEDLHADAINTTYQELNQAGRKGYGKDWNYFPGDGKGDLPNELKKNLYMFSGAKTYSMLEQLNGFLYDQSGRLRPYNEFEVLARKLNRQYNRNWLQAEWQTARTAAQMAQKWERLQETKDLFPNLEFRTVGDDRVRDAHRELHGIIKPIDDEFWSKYYPPLNWRCRCDAVPTAADPKGEVPKDMPEPNFKGNVAKDEEIFTQKHNFFKLLNGNENAKRNMELMKLNAPHIKHSKNKKVEVSIFADKKDLSQNLESAIKIADNLNIKVQIRPHLDTNIAKGFTNPEYQINGYRSDLKSEFKKENYKGIQNAFKEAIKQGLESIVFDFTKSFTNLNLTEINRLTLSHINEKRGKQFKEVFFIYKHRVIKVSRETIVKRELRQELEKLKADS